ILIGNGDGTFQIHGTVAVQYSGGLAMGDFNADGIPDLAATGEYPRKVLIFLGNGDGSFSAARAFPAGTTPVSVAVADFTQDGKADLAVADYYGNNVTLLVGSGDGNFAASRFSPFYTAPNPIFIIAGDFNGD